MSDAEGRAMWALPVRIKYVDRDEPVAFDASEWAGQRAEAVDYVQYPRVQHAGSQVYYLRPERITEEGEMAWIAGAFALYVEGPAREHVMRETGECLYRVIRSEIPDLMHAEVKIGWWRR